MCPELCGQRTNWLVQSNPLQPFVGSCISSITFRNCGWAGWIRLDRLTTLRSGCIVLIVYLLRNKCSHTTARCLLTSRSLSYEGWNVPTCIVKLFTARSSSGRRSFLTTPVTQVTAGLECNRFDYCCLIDIHTKPSAVEPSLLQTRRSGTLYRTASRPGSQQQQLQGNYLRRTSSAVTQHTQRSRDAA